MDLVADINKYYFISEGNSYPERFKLADTMLSLNINLLVVRATLSVVDNIS